MKCAAKPSTGLVCGFLLFPAVGNACDDDLAKLVKGLREDYRLSGFMSADINNDHIMIETPRIHKIDAVGPKALKPLIQEMKRPNVTVDTFARCYSACDQILYKAGLKSGVRWYGGHIRVKEKDGSKEWRIIGTSRIDGFSKAFRKEQINEIIHRAKDVKIHIVIS